MFRGLIDKALIGHVTIDIKTIMVSDQRLCLLHGKLIAEEHVLRAQPLEVTTAADKGHCPLSRRLLTRSGRGGAAR